MTRVHVTQRANADLLAIKLYIAVDSARSAAAMVRRLRDGFRRLTVHPEVGSRRADTGGEDFRYLVVGGYSIVYTVEGNEAVVIHRVLGPGQTLGR